MTRTHEKVSAQAENALARTCLGPGGAADLVQRAVSAINGRWKLAIIFRLFETPLLRFSELERDIAGVSQKMLTQHLRELEVDGLVRRTDHLEVPPRVDYQLTEVGLALRPALNAIRSFAETRWQSSPERAPRDMVAEGSAQDT